MGTDPNIWGGVPDLGGDSKLGGSRYLGGGPDLGGDSKLELGGRTGGPQTP